MDVVNRLVHNNVPPFPEEISGEDVYFLQQCFSRRPVDRPSADQIVAFVHGESLRCMTRTLRSAAGGVRLLNLCSYQD